MSSRGAPQCGQGGVGSQNLIGPLTKKVQLDKVAACDKRVAAEGQFGAVIPTTTRTS